MAAPDGGFKDPILRPGGPPVNIVLLGPPAGGKGTQAGYLAERYGMIHIPMGDLLRARAKFLPQLAEYISQGELVPDDVVVSVLKERLADSDCFSRGVLLDGFPRTRAQAEALRNAGVDISAVIHLKVADEVVVDRISGRRIDPLSGKIYHVKDSPPPPEIQDRVIQREDDTPETIRRRLVTYHQERDAILDFCGDRVRTIHVGDGSPSALPADVRSMLVFDEVRKAVEGDTYWGSVIRSELVAKAFECGTSSTTLVSLSHRQECERLSANLEDLQEQTAIICDERDVARKHEEELFYVIRRKDEELLRARAVLADLSQLVEEEQLADEAAELLGNVAGMEYDELYDRCSQLEAQNMELRAERERYEEAYKRCAQLEAEVAELRAERSRANRKREKLAEQKHELQEKLKLSEQLRQAARDRCEQILQQGQKRGSDSQGALEELARSMEDLAGTGTKPQRSLQRSRTVGAIGGSGAAAAEALSSMRAMGKQADSGFRPDDLSMGGAVLPVFGMPIEPLGDGSGPNTGRSGRSGRSVRSSVSGPAVAEAQPTSPSFGAKDETTSRASTSRHSRGKSPKPGV